MPLYKKIIIILSNNLFRILLFFTISIIAAVIIYTDRTYIPSVLSRNEVYDKVVPALLETNKEQSLTVGGDVTLDDPDIQKIINEAFPANELEKYTNEVLESMYKWLNNESPNLQFTIDLTENKQRLATGLSNYAVNRLQNLPICSEQSSEIDPFSATCQPLFIDYGAEQQKLELQLLNESGFINDPIITQETFFGGDTEQSFNEQYKDVPTYYSLATASPVYVCLILLALALIVIFTSSTKKKGIGKIGFGLIGAGSSLIFFTLLFTYAIPSVTGSLPIFQSSGQGIDSLLNEVTIDFGRDYSWMIVKISLPLLLIGLMMTTYSKVGLNIKNYKSVKLKSGVVSGNEQKKKATKVNRKSRPPIQSSESSDTKPKRKLKNKKYRKIPKKEL